MQTSYLRTIVKVIAYVGYAFACLLVSACTPAPTGLEALVDYQQRVANTIDQPAITPDLPAPAQPPQARELRTFIEPLNLSFLDTLRLDQCPLGQLLAHRNSSLGRLTSGLRRYHQDRLIAQALVECAKLVEDSALQQRLAEAAVAKQNQLPLLAAQAIAEEKALQQSFRFGPAGLTELDASKFSPYLSALQTINRLLNPESPQLPSEQELEQALQQLEQGDYLQSLWRTLHDQDHYLIALTPLVAHLPKQGGCLSAGTPTRARVLRNVFIQYFSGPVQQQISQATREAQHVEPYFNALIDALQVHPNYQPLIAHYQSLQALPTSLTRNTREHVRYWQKFFEACDFKPGTP